MTILYALILYAPSAQTSEMDTVQITCVLNNVGSFLGAFASDMLPHSVTLPSTIIVNTDVHTQSGSHWLAIHLEPRSSTAYYFDSYGLSPNIHDIQTFLRRNCTVLNYNTLPLQGPMSTVCGKYCCLFALCMDRGYTGKQFVGLFTPNIADSQVEQFFTEEFGSLRGLSRGGLCCSNMYKR
jgi:hypothetical protein